jgi:hypothetical protein
MLDGLFGVVRSIFNDSTEIAGRPKLRLVGGITGVDNAANKSTDLFLMATKVTSLANRAGVYDGQHAHCEGYSSRGDGGGGDFVWDASSTATHNWGTVVAVTGVATGRWLRVRVGNLINVRWFGAKADWNGTTGTDNTAAIQAAIDYAMDNGKGIVFIPAGLYKISGTLHLFSTTLSLHSCVLEGEGYAYASEAPFSGTGLICTHSDQPAINIQGARGSAVRGMAIAYPTYRTFISNRSLAQIVCASYDDTDPASWDDPASTANAESRYTPHAAITIDGWSNTATPTKYPQTVRSYVSDGLASSDVTLEYLQITGFNTAICVKPADAQNNADFTAIHSVNIESCKWGISIGNSQSRSVSIQNVNGVIAPPASCSLPCFWYFARQMTTPRSRSMSDQARCRMARARCP